MKYKRLISILLFTAIVMVTLALPAHAAGNINVSLTPTATELTVGDPVELTLEVNHPADYQVIVPQLEHSWGPFEIKQQSPVTTVDNQDGSATTRQTIQLTAFTLGTLESPQLPLTIIDATGQALAEDVPAVALTVVPTLPEGDTTLRDIRPQVGMIVPSMVPMVLAGLALALVVAAAGWWGYRRWRGGAANGAVIDNRLPYERALDELARIEALGLVEQNRFKEHYSLVTDCLRSYLEEQFGLHAHDRTTTELKATLRRSPLAPIYSQEFLDLFADSDLVKFAKLTPYLEEARELPDRARTLVKLTRPKPAQTETKEAESIITTPPQNAVSQP